ncbi:MAG: hypothetical protein ACTHMK_13820 [Dyella sp.]|uniref:hypothetical protein n=1 Tax=Dyella sp. TaxID=1869338 RepID=UPI003F7DB6CD
MENEDGIHLFPLVGWEKGDVEETGDFILRPLFLTHSMQPKSEASRSERWYALSPGICRSLAAELLAAADRLEGTASRPPDQGVH